MRIAVFHGWELTGSGSNEYVRYLSRALARAGHEVHVPCREEHPERIAHVDAAYRWDGKGGCEELFSERDADQPGTCTVHVLPHGNVRPVFVTDKQREGNVQAFSDMGDTDLADYLDLATHALRDVLRAHPVDVVHANHTVPQPTIAAKACEELGIPFIIYPHGSAIEYTVHRDARFQSMLRQAVLDAEGLIIGSDEVRQRILDLYPDLDIEIRARSRIIGVGVDTALFEPVAKDKRLEAMSRFKLAAPSGGKSPALEDELRRRLDAGETEAVREYAHAYPRAYPDESVAQKVDEVPWLDGNTMLFVGALTVGKGLQSVIVSLPEVLREVPDAHLIIVGSGAYREVLEALVHAIATGNAELLDYLTANGNDLDKTHLAGPWTDVASYLCDEEAKKMVLAAGSSFANHVHFLGRLNHDLLQFIFPCADIALFPSVIPEAYPLVLMEALANGVLPLASDFSGFAEGLDNLVGDLGAERVELMRLPMQDDIRVAGIARRVSALLAEQHDWSSELRAIATARYDWSIRAEQMASAYRDFVA